MMNKIFRDLQENVKKHYKDNNIITINKFLHYSLNNSEMADLYKKYKGNVEKLKKELESHINHYELNKNKKATQKRMPQDAFTFNDPFFNDIFDQQFSEIFGESLNPNIIYQDKDITVLYSLAQKFEIKKIQRQAQETGQIGQPDDLSVSSFLRAVIELSANNQKYAYLLKIIKDTGFDIEKFIKDDNAGKSKNKKLIEEHCTNLNKKAAEGRLLSVIGRESEIEQLVNVLKKARKNNPILVGKAGVGKTAIVEGLAKRIFEKDVPDGLKNAVIYELRVMDMVKGTSFRGQFEQKMSDLLEEFKDLEDSGELPILFIDEIHTIMGAGSGGQGGLDFSNIIKPALARGELRTIGATTTEEWYKFIKENPALDRRFVSVTIKEPSPEDSLKIIEGSISFYEKSHSVKYKKEAIERAIELSQQFIVDNALPDKAFDLIDYSGAMCSVQRKKIVDIEDIEIALSRHKNIEIDAISESRRGNLEPIGPKLKKVIFGQNEAIDKISRTVEKAIAGLSPKDKPIGCFLFSGPTGVGKTELAKQISRLMKANFLRLDMSEFQESHSVAKLIGAPAGYVGYDDGSSLTKNINENPRTVLLLDEIEKAHPDVYKLFLQVMDYGKLTDSKGKEINFRNVLLIMTTNAGTKELKRTIGLNSEIQNINNKELERIFSPEFRARLSGNGPIEFNMISSKIMEQIVDKYIAEIQEDRLKRFMIRLKLTPEAKKQIVDMAMSKNLGSRPIKDFIENKIIEPLTELVLFGKLKNNKKEVDVKIELQNQDIILSV